jgi:hypothetical protein
MISENLSTVSKPQTFDGSDRQRDFEELSLLYVENAKVAATFWEWRHKVMTRFFTAFAGIVIAVGWIYERKELRHLLFIPMVIGAVYSTVSFLMDRVNRKILLGCYETGREIERQIGSVRGAYGRMLDEYGKVNYTVFLRALYLSSATLFLLAAVVAFVLTRR